MANRHERHRSFNAFLSPEHIVERRPLEERRPRSRDSRDPGVIRRRSLHRRYHSDNEIEESRRRSWLRESREQRVPSPPGFRPNSDIRPSERIWIPLETRLPIRADPDIPVRGAPQILFARMRQNGSSSRRRRTPSPSSSSSSSEREGRRRRSDMRIPSPPRPAWNADLSSVPESVLGGVPEIDFLETERGEGDQRPRQRYYGTRPSPPRLARHSPSPPRTTRPEATLPPPLTQRRSSTQLIRANRQDGDHGLQRGYRRESSPALFITGEGDQAPGMQSRRQDRDSGEIHPMPGGFPPATPDSLPSDYPLHEKRKNRRPWSKSVRSETPSTSSSKRTSISGVLGPKTYQFTPLRSEPGETEFRLIKILPARMAAIKCEIFHASLDDPPEYIAISYAWGDTEDTRKITVDGVTISVAVSLHGALQALRQKKEAVICWVDSICIDQQNRDERTQQVQLMTQIYTQAIGVAIWLGPEADDSHLAIRLLGEIAANATSEDYVRALISAPESKTAISAIVFLFERDYWRRLWVVQEVYNARDITVYCGSLKLPWSAYRIASNVFWRHKSDIEYYYPGTSSNCYQQNVSQSQFTYSQVLVYQGPSSLPDVGSFCGLGDDSLLEVMRACRGKLSSDARDKVFGVLGVLPEEIRNEFPVDYSLSAKVVYTHVVDYLLETTERLDVIRESIHFPLHISSASLPSWVPDWSHIPATTALRYPNFSASGDTKVKHRFLDERRRALEISAIFVDTVKSRGISVGTLCTLADYLMAFLHWRALLLSTYDTYEDVDVDLVHVEEAFCKALCLNQVPTTGGFNSEHAWLTACYHVFASLIQERLPRMPMDTTLKSYVDMTRGQHDFYISPSSRRRFLQEHFGAKMMGRCFFLTDGDRIGMGTGFMAVGDVIVVPLGCQTPIILRPEGPKGEYRYVGDAYLYGWMSGKAIRELSEGRRKVEQFVMH